MIFHPELKVKNNLLLKHGLTRERRFDFTEYDISKIIEGSVWDMVIASAVASQQSLELLFEPGDVIFHPEHLYFFEVERVYDTRLRMPPNMGIFIDAYSRALGKKQFRSTEIVQASCLMAAHEPYNPNLHIINAETTEEAISRLAIVLSNLGTIE